MVTDSRRFATAPAQANWRKLLELVPINRESACDDIMRNPPTVSGSKDWITNTAWAH